MTPLTWNTDRAGRRSRAYGGWRNWKDQDAWKSLDSGFLIDSGVYVASQIPGRYSVPALATGTVTLEVDGRYDIFSKSAITESAFVLEATPENASPVSATLDDNSPNIVTYPNAFGQGVDLRYTVWLGRGPRTTREVVIRSEPAGDNDVTQSWILRSSNARTYVPSGPGGWQRPWSGNVSDSATVNGFGIALRSGTSLDNESLIRGAGIRTPQAWYYKPDGEMVRTNIPVMFEVLSTTSVRATKTIPRAFIQEAFAAGATAVMADDTTTFYPDPNAETTSVDGTADRYSQGTWSSLRDGTGEGASDSLSSVSVAVWTGSASDTYQVLLRGITLFDVSSLAGQTLTSADYHATYNVKYQNIPATSAVALCGCDPASNTALVAGDYSTFGDTRFADSDVSEADWASGLSYSLNAAGLAAIAANIADDGIVKLGLRMNHDIDDVAPAWTGASLREQLSVRSADYAGTSSDPYLEVVTASMPGNPAAMMLGT